MRRRIKSLHFKNKEEYDKWVAYGHLHVKSFGRKPRPRVYIHGRLHKVRR